MAEKKQMVKKTTAKPKKEEKTKVGKNNVAKKTSEKKVAKTKDKKVEKPQMLYNQKTSKTELLKQSNIISVSKKTKDKNSVEALPSGVRKSVEEKERILSALSYGKNNNIEDIRKKFSIEKEPLTKKRAGEIKAERINFFKANIEKNQKGKLKSFNIVDSNELLKEIKENSSKKNQDKIQQIAEAGNIASKRSEQNKVQSTSKKSETKKTSVAKKPVKKGSSKTSAKKPVSKKATNSKAKAKK